jgi:hypothetical protein
MATSDESWSSVFATGDGSQRWKLWGDLPPATEDELRTQMLSGVASPPNYESEWLAVAQTADGQVFATCSAMYTSGFFWTTDHDGSGRKRLLIAPGPEALIRERREKTILDEGYIRAFLGADLDPRHTPYVGVHRVQPGVLAQWKSPEARPEESPWEAPDLTKKPTLEGPAAMAAYLEAFDSTITDLMNGNAPLAASLSGGLDSTFLVASMAQQTSTDRPIHAFTHRPHPDAQLTSRSNWDPDDSEYALMLEKQYPGKVKVTTLFNEDIVQPLDAARRAAERSWFPTFSPANQIWIDNFQQRASDLGADRLFVGQKGNASFSQEPTYAAEYYLSHGRIDKLMALTLAGGESEMSVAESLHRRVLSPLKGRVFGGQTIREPLSMATLGLPHSTTPKRASAYQSREEFLEWLNPLTSAHYGLSNRPGVIIPGVDPFTAFRVVNIASQITPLEWSRGLFPRGFARRAGAGRVPDEVRFRTRRGGQSWDAWFVIRNAQERYREEVALLDSTPGIEDWVDSQRVAAMVDSWFSTEDKLPSLGELNIVTRLLATADFSRLTAQRLAEL